MDWVFSSTFMKESLVIFSDHCNAKVNVRMSQCKKENAMGSFFLVLFSFALLFFFFSFSFGTTLISAAWDFLYF